MRLTEYSPLAHGIQVFALWQRTLGQQYPLSTRVFLSYTTGRLSYEPGDAIVVIRNDTVVGFGMLELDRQSVGPRGWGSITAILVDPACQRQGIGSTLLHALETRLRQAGVSEIHLGNNSHAFWQAVPDDLPAARSFFLSHGYDLATRCFDLVMPLEDYEISPRYRKSLNAADAQVLNATPETIGAVLALEQREFPEWYSSMLRLLATDMENILFVQSGIQVLGTIQTFTPQSRLRVAGLQWEEIHGASMGAIGAVGIAREWRGKGLGAAMCQSAALHVKNHGGSCCYIEEVLPGTVGFYQKIGAEVWRGFFRGVKRLE